MSRTAQLFRALAAVLLWCSRAEGQESRVPFQETLPTRDRLRMDRPFYRNFAFENYVNYPDHSSPYTDRPRSYYGSMGDFLITGYELYSWALRRNSVQSDWWCVRVCGVARAHADGKSGSWWRRRYCMTCGCASADGGAMTRFCCSVNSP